MPPNPQPPALYCDDQLCHNTPTTLVTFSTTHRHNDTDAPSRLLLLCDTCLTLWQDTEPPNSYTTEPLTPYHSYYLPEGKRITYYPPPDT